MALDNGDKLYPYMNSRNYPVADVYDSATMAKFSYVGTIRFQWGEASGAPNDFCLTALGQWGGIRIGHAPILWVVNSLPGTYQTYATRALMEADINNVALNVGTKLTSDDNGFDGDYALVGGTDYYYLHRYSSHGRKWLPVRTRTANGSATINGVSCNIYYCDVAVSDMVSVAGEVMDADEIFDLCWAVNGRHAEPGSSTNSWDSSFKLTPEGYPPQDQNDDRRELNARVAGQKAIKQDEMLTRSQIQPGDNVQFEYLDDAGQGALGYTGTAAEGFNILIHGLPGTTHDVGTDVVSGVNLGSGSAIAWGSESLATGIEFVVFSDEPDWIYDALLLRTGINPGTTWGIDSIPVHFQIYESPTGKVHVSGRTLHSGLYMSHDDGTTVTQKNAAPNGTISHIQFADNADVVFDLTETYIDGHRGYRAGVVVTAQVIKPVQGYFTVGKQPVQFTDNLNANWGVWMLQEDNITKLTFVDSQWRGDLNTDLYQMRYRYEQMYGAVEYAAWDYNEKGADRLVVPRYHTPIQFYLKPDNDGQMVVSGSVPYSGVMVGLNTALTMVSDGFNFPALGSYEIPSTSASSYNTRYLTVDTKFTPLAKALDGEIRLQLEDFGDTQDTIDESSPTEPIVEGKVIRLDDRIRANAVRLQRRNPILLQPVYNPQVGFYQYASAYIPQDFVVYGQNLYTDMVGGAGTEPSARYPTLGGDFIWPNKPGIYRVNVEVAGTSIIPVMDPMPGAYPRAHSRVKIIIRDFYRSPNPPYVPGQPGAVANGYYATGGPLENNELHPFNQVTGSGEWSLSYDFTIPIGEYDVDPTISASGLDAFRIWIEVEYPQGYLGARDRLYTVTECLVDLHLLETHPRKPHHYRNRII